MPSKRKKQHYKRCDMDEVIVRLCDLYKDLANVLDEPYYAAEVARIIYDLTGDVDWTRKRQEQFDIWVKGGMQ
jgi:hypothetical protein